jgi:predicted ABC-type transport system involved in lysophospholipase L1 biosynthesis ATPase subunit
LNHPFKKRDVSEDLVTRPGRTLATCPVPRLASRLIRRGNICVTLLGKAKKPNIEDGKTLIMVTHDRELTKRVPCMEELRDERLGAEDEIDRGRVQR